MLNKYITTRERYITAKQTWKQYLLRSENEFLSVVKLVITVTIIFA